MFCELLGELCVGACALVLIAPQVAHADVVSDNDMTPESIHARVAELNSQIAAVDAQLADCKSAVSNWKTATIIGGVGVVGTGIGIAVQSHKLGAAKKAGKVAVETETDKKE